MKIGKLWPIALAFVASALIASASALAVAPAEKNSPAKLDVPAYMLTAANTDDNDYMSCIRKGLKAGNKDAAAKVKVALDCQVELPD